jgi:hypothetical protein
VHAQRSYRPILMQALIRTSFGFVVAPNRSMFLITNPKPMTAMSTF